MLAPDVEIEIGGKGCVMRPTIKAMMAIEQELGENSMRIVTRTMQGDVGARDAMVILFHGLRGGNNMPAIEKADIEAELEGRGIAAMVPYLVKFLTAHLAGQPKVGKPQEG